MPVVSKVAVVLGGTAGVGRAVVAGLIDEGFRVGVLARGQSRLDALAEEYGNSVLCLPCDAGDADAVARAGATVDEVLGAVDVWVNAAMATSFSPFPDVLPDEFERIVQTTLFGVVNGTRTALSLMERRNRGRIVNVGSGLGYTSVPYQAAYCAAKHAINGFTDSVRTELLHEGSDITISLVQLPAINTPQFDWALNRMPKKPQPAPPIFQPTVAAEGVLRAVREGRREYFVGSSVLQLVFGNMVLPNYVQHKLAQAGVDAQKSDDSEPGHRPNNLHEPVGDIPSTATGRFGREARDTGLIVDADRMRKGVFFGAVCAALGLGLIAGLQERNARELTTRRHAQPRSLPAPRPRG